MRRVAAMTDDRNGQVVTFYSYKGGTGRTMALANTAWILAANGKRVLVVDWDLESPGLHRFFGPFIDAGAMASAGGVIDLIREYEWDASRAENPGELPHERYAKVHRHAFTVDWSHFPDGATLDFLSAGRQNRDYAASISGLNWDAFYENLAGGMFFDALRRDMKREYDYVLIDSRTGLSDVADICTLHLPDVLVDCFTLSEQGIDGAAAVARNLRHRSGQQGVRILPVAMRVDPAEKVKADRGREVAKQRFAGLPAVPPAERDAYWAAVYVPYQAFYAYEETLATFADQSGSTGTLLSAYEGLTARITDGTVTGLPPLDEGLRRQVNAMFIRQPAPMEEQVVLRYQAEDTAWAEWMEHLLVSAGVRVGGVTSEPAAGAERVPARDMVIISRLGPEGTVPVRLAEQGERPLAVYVGETASLATDIPVANSALVGGVGAAEAAERILKLIGRSGVASSGPAGGPRFPGTEPAVFNAPARNARFTGRERDLRQLRGQLRTDRTAVVVPSALPVALHGMGGIGKTQVAMEYAYRFRTSYDVVWWIDADTTGDVDTALVDLGNRLKMAAQANVPEGAQTVLQALSRGEPYDRWLLIFDNAEDPERLSQLMPKGGHGHVLVTSRDPSWGDRAQAIAIDVFERDESIAHLTQRVSRLTRDEAARVAESLGDLPIAVAAAAAWLAETGSSAADYLQQIEHDGLSALSVEASHSQRVEATWDLALQRLQARSPAAYRLLQLCSLLAPEIGLELIYSDAMAETLKPYDKSVSDRLVRGTLVQQISRLALLRMDQRGERRLGSDWFDRLQGGQVVVHRVLQLVVRARMSADALGEARHQVHLLLAAARPQGEVDDPERWPGYRVLIPHLDVSSAGRCTAEPVRQLLIDRVRYNYLRGNSGRGRELAEEYEQAWTDQLESTEDTVAQQVLRRQILQLRFNLANILRDQGQFEESLKLDAAILPQQQELLGAEHPHTLMTAGSLAADLRGLGRYGEALAQDERTYDAWADAFGDDHPRTLAALSNLAVSHRLMGNIREAQERDELAYQRRRVVLSDVHPHTLLSATSLGRDLREMGEYKQSVALLTSVCETSVNVFGPGSRQALNAQANLAVSLRNGGNSQEAARLLETAYAQLNETVGPSNPDTLACRLSRAVNMFQLSLLAEAEQELRAVMDAYESSLGPSHPHTLVCISNLAAFTRRIGDSQTALGLARTANEHLGQVLGEDHPYALAALMNVAICTHDVGQTLAALDLIDDAGRRLTQVLGSEHPHTIRCRANHALLQRLAGLAPPGAELVYIEQLARRIGDDHGAVVALRDGRLLRRIIDPHPF
jgi:MinD-like ATPase involved in chromosome partitioning or flagellar assembly/tetratricopeptide (TPR) repeat protein